MIPLLFSSQHIRDIFSRIPNLRIFFTIFFLLKQGRIFLLRSKSFTKKDTTYVDPLEENKTFFVNTIRGFVDSEFVKICHEQVNSFVSKDFVHMTTRFGQKKLDFL